MSRITLKSMSYKYFKGIKDLKIIFGEKETTISGKNGSCKTTTFDGFSFLLFGKNSQDKKDFEVKPLDENNNYIHKVETEVEAILDVDGMTTTIKRVFREKWTKPKGQSEEIFSGHETTLFWNEVPVNQSDFKAKVDSLCSEDVFKMITNPYGFTSLHWKDQRDVLFKIAGGVSDEEVASGNKEFEELLAKITGKNFDEFKKELAAKRKKLNDELKLIPARIDETKRGMPESVDTAAIEKEIATLTAEIDKIEGEIADRSKANESVLKEREDQQKRIYALRAEIVDIEEKASQEEREANRASDNERSEINTEITRLEKLLERLDSNITETQEEIVTLDAEMTELRTQWEKVNEKEVTFEEGISKCPTCSRDFDAEDVESKKAELTANFNTEKQKELEAISIKGKKKKELSESLLRKKIDIEDERKSTKSDLDLTKEKLEGLKPTEDIPTPTPEIAKLKEEIQAIQKDLDTPTEDVNADLTAKRTEIRSQIDELKKSLSVKDQIEKDNARIVELEGQAKSMGQEIADLEKMEFTMSEFTKKKIEAIEGKINEKFSTLTWKMYRKLINSGEEPCCECLINGVPYSDANTGSKMRAGLEIINALCEYYDTYAPCFLDNRESVQSIPEMKSQIINLVVSNDEKLTVR